MWNIHFNNNHWFCGYVSYPIRRFDCQQVVEASNLKDTITLPKNTLIYLVKGVARKGKSIPSKVQMSEHTYCIYFQRQVSRVQLASCNRSPKSFFIPSLRHKLKCLTKNPCSTLYFWIMPTRPNQYSFDS